MSSEINIQTTEPVAVDRGTPTDTISNAQPVTDSVQVETPVESPVVTDTVTEATDFKSESVEATPEVPEKTERVETEPEIKILKVDDLLNVKSGDIVYLKPEDIRYNPNIYPRSEGYSQTTVDEYAEDLEKLPPILINQKGEPLDGVHRWRAHLQAEVDRIACKVQVTESEAEDRAISVKTNVKHGLKLTKADKISYAQREWGNTSDDKLIEDLSITKKTLYNWTKDLRAKQEAEDIERISNMWLSCETHETIAEAVNMVRQTVSDKIRKIAENCKISQTGIFADFALEGSKLLVSSVWTSENGINVLPTEVLENLLYYLTEPTDIVFDPFGNIATIKMCKNRLRRFYVCNKDSDNKDIRKHDISTGLPDGLPVPNLIILNPFTADVSPEQVTSEKIGEIAKGLKDKLRNKFAYLVLVTPEMGNFKEDKDLSLIYAMVVARYFEYRYEIFLSSPSPDEWDIDYARESKDILGVHRKLLIFTNGKPESKAEVKEEEEPEEVTTPEPEPVKQEAPEPEVKTPEPVKQEAPEEVATPVVTTASEAKKQTEVKQPTKEEMLANSRKAMANKSNGSKSKNSYK